MEVSLEQGEGHLCWSHALLPQPVPARPCLNMDNMGSSVWAEPICVSTDLLTTHRLLLLLGPGSAGVVLADKAAQFSALTVYIYIYNPAVLQVTAARGHWPLQAMEPLGAASSSRPVPLADTGTPAVEQGRSPAAAATGFNQHLLFWVSVCVFTAIPSPCCSFGSHGPARGQHRPGSRAGFKPHRRFKWWSHPCDSIPWVYNLFSCSHGCTCAQPHTAPPKPAATLGLCRCSCWAKRPKELQKSPFLCL